MGEFGALVIIYYVAQVFHYTSIFVFHLLPLVPKKKNKKSNKETRENFLSTSPRMLSHSFTAYLQLFGCSFTPPFFFIPIQRLTKKKWEETEVWRSSVNFKYENNSHHYRVRGSF